MVVPQQKNLFTKRWRGVKAPSPREDTIQMEVVKYFNVMKVPSAKLMHIPNEEMRKERYGKLKAMGACPGAADLLFIRRHCGLITSGHRIAGWSVDPQPVVLFLELKRLGEKPTDTQIAFGEAMKACGCHYEWADSKQMAVEILERYAFVRRDVSVRRVKEKGAE